MSSILDPIVAAAESRGDRAALLAGDRMVSYGELVRAALAFGGVLRGSGERVAVEATRTPETVAAILGVLCAGKSYVPLNPGDPPLRQRRILRSARASHVVAGERFRGVGHGVTVIAPPELAGIAGVPARPFAPPAPEREAYVFFTSGSTGAPKGVPLTHANARAFVDWAKAAFELGPDDRIGACSPLFFDISVLDVFAGLGAGASVVLVPDHVTRFPRACFEYLRAAAVSVLYTVPSALRTILAARPPGGALDSLRLLLLAGEPFPAADLDAVRAAAPGAALHNLYGPIEANVVSAFAVPRDWPAGVPVPIGWAASGATLAIASEQDTPVTEAGASGEIVVRGPSVFHGYLPGPGAPPTPFVEVEGRRWYRTGDLGEIGADGAFRYRGRDDDRIKCRGFLVELAEVEAALACAPDVVGAAAVAVGHDTADPAIHAFVVSRSRAVEAREVISWCMARLPRYMWPAEVHVVDELPVARTGKVDRLHLGRLAERAAS
jgi:amino acid adenylation domain-containing protein